MVLVGAAVVGWSACSPGQPTTPTPAITTGMTTDMSALADSRGLTPDDVKAALKTYVPSGKHDEYLMFASGGHSGQAHVIGLPSMRLLKTIGVFTPEPWQGYGYGSKDSMELLEQGDFNDVGLRWGDTHHPAPSETNGDYDGQFLFITERISVIGAA